MIKSLCTLLMTTLALLCSTGSFTLGHAEEPLLPAAAQQTYDNGLFAAKMEDWALAVSHFTEAQKSAERHPHVLYSLGLAHARAGHELAGAAWLQAYLAAVPAAPDADAVRKEISRLESVADTTTRKVFEAALTAAVKVPSREIRMTRLYNLCVSQANAGYFDEFQKTRDKLCNEYSTPGDCENIRGTFLWQNYIGYLADVGEFHNAGQLANSFPDDELLLEFMAEINIVNGRVLLGDCKGARENLSRLEERNRWSRSFTCDRINAGQDKEYNIELLALFGRLMLHLADRYAENGQPDDYRRLLTEANQLAVKYNLDPELQSDISSALKNDPTAMNKCPDLTKMDPVEMWIELAREISGSRIAVDLKGRLLETREETSSDKLSDGLTKIAEEHAQLFKKIRMLEKQCEYASALRQ